MERHLPSTLICSIHGKQPVVSSQAIPPGEPRSVIRTELTAVEATLACQHTRSFGTIKARICSHLEMALEDISDRNEVRNQWEACKE